MTAPVGHLSPGQDQSSERSEIENAEWTKSRDGEICGTGLTWEPPGKAVRLQPRLLCEGGEESLMCLPTPRGPVAGSTRGRCGV